MSGALESIEGLQAKHVAVLVDLDIRTPGDLARVDRRAVHAAMRRLRPRPELEEISRWQDAARDIAIASADPEWEQAAAFVVSFERRPTEAGPQRRVVAEQAERTTPPPRQVWPGWQCEPVGAWLAEQAGAEATDTAGNVAPADGAAPPQGPAANGGPAGPRPPSDAPVSARDGLSGRTAAGRSNPRPTATLEEAALVTVGAPVVDLVTAEEALVEPRARLRVTVSGALPPGGVSVALRLRRPGRPSTVPHDPVVVRAGVPVEIDLDRVPSGAFAAVLAMWAPDGALRPSVVPLARIRRADLP